MIAHDLCQWIEARQPLEPFQRRFIRGAFRPGVRLAALSGPRGLGKSALSGWLLAAGLDPTGPLYVKGAESVLLAGSLDQARAVFRFLRQRCDGDDFRYLDSGQRVAATHKPTHTRVRVASSDPRKALGIVGARLLVGDEPGAWQERGGSEITSVPQSQAQASASCGRARSGGEWVVKRSSRGRRSKMLSCSTCSIWLRLQRSRRTNLR